MDVPYFVYPFMRGGKTQKDGRVNCLEGWTSASGRERLKGMVDTFSFHFHCDVSSQSSVFYPVHLETVHLVNWISASLCSLWSSGQLSIALPCSDPIFPILFPFSFTLATLEFAFQQNTCTWPFPQALFSTSLS